MPTKERAKSHLNEDRSREIFKQALPREWVFRNYSPDYGIDLSIELFSEIDGKFYTQGEHIYIQLKSIERPILKRLKIEPRYNIEKSPPATQKTEGEKAQEITVIKYQIETSLLETVEKMGSAVPVLLVLVDVTTSNIFYICLNDYIEKVIVPLNPGYCAQKKITLNIPVKNRLDEKNSRQIIEWYAKRPKLFAFFNKVAYQYHELQYSNGDAEMAKHFSAIIARLDAWSASKYFPALDYAKQKFFYYFKHGKPKDADVILSQLKELGLDIDAEEWESGAASEPTSLSASMQIQQTLEIWRIMDNVGRIFEDIIKECDLPTYIGHDMAYSS